MKPIKYFEGNLFDNIPENPNGDVFISHVCNNEGYMGAGFAAQVAKKWPKVDKDYKAFVKETAAGGLGCSQLLKINSNIDSSLYIINMVAQTLYKTPKYRKIPLLYSKLADCMEKASEMVDRHSMIIAPTFGSALAGGNWSFIEALIEELWLPICAVTIFKYGCLSVR